MSIGRFSSPPPQAPFTHEGLLRWAINLVAWLATQEGEAESTLEDDFLFGGALVANRMFGIEGAETAAAVGDYLIVPAPAAGKKKVVMDLVVCSPASGGATIDVRLYKKVGASEYYIDSGSISAGSPLPLPESIAKIVLDGEDEEIWIEVVANAGGNDAFWNGNYLAVD